MKLTKEIILRELITAGLLFEFKENEYYVGFREDVEISAHVNKLVLRLLAIQSNEEGTSNETNT